MHNKHDSPLTTPPITAQAFIDIAKPPFNAVGDGVTDDAAAIQAAVNASASGVVRFPSDESGHGANVCSTDDPGAP